MKRVFRMLCTGILLVCFLSGCEIAIRPGSSKPDGSAPDSNVPGSSAEGAVPELREPVPAALRQKISQSGSVVGIAFIGYVDSEDSEADLRACFAGSETGKDYPGLSSAPLYMAEGQELYAIVPSNDKGTITVYSSAMTGDGEYAEDKNTPLHTGKPGEPLLLRCNLSENYSNVMITAADGGGAIDFRPSLSMENGHLQEIVGVYDFSVYEKQPDERSVQIATEILLEADEVRYAVEQGMKLIYTGDTKMIEGRICLLFALETDRDGQLVRKGCYGVCDNLIYVYDDVSEAWTALGVG